jgi:hypothetical protein
MNSAEQAELRRLRAEVKQLCTANEILRTPKANSTRQRNSA